MARAGALNQCQGFLVQPGDTARKEQARCRHNGKGHTGHAFATHRPDLPSIPLSPLKVRLQCTLPALPRIKPNQPASATPESRRRAPQERLDPCLGVLSAGSPRQRGGFMAQVRGQTELIALS